jgi:hypothetical protein
MLSVAKRNEASLEIKFLQDSSLHWRWAQNDTFDNHVMLSVAKRNEASLEIAFLQDSSLHWRSAQNDILDSNLLSASSPKHQASGDIGMFFSQQAFAHCQSLHQQRFGFAVASL